MKKILLIICLFLLPLNVYAISARNAIVMDLNSGRVLYDIKSHDEHLIASITKIMTTLVAITYGDLNKEVQASESILKAYGSSIYLTVGEKMKLEDLLYGLILRSGNDASIAIAEAVGGSTEGFVYLMNEYAKIIGMKNTHFVNPHGLDNKGVGNTSSAYDMAILTKVAMENDTFRKIFGTTYYKTESDIKHYSWEGKNKLFKMYKYTTGGKTGFTESARRTLVTTAKKDNMELVVVTLHDPDDFIDHRSLYETYFNKYYAVKVLDKNNFKLDDNYYKNVSFYIKDDYYALVNKNEEKDLEIEYNIYKDMTIIDNIKIGEAKVKLKDMVLHTESIYAKNIKPREETKKTLWQKIKGWFKSW